MKILITILLFSCLNARATNYYFADAGNDANAGTQISPWKTITKLNSVWLAGTFNPGDTIFLKRGDVFFGQILPKEGGTSSNPIVITSYGSGDDAKITASIDLTFTSVGSNIYASQVYTSTGQFVVTKNGYPQLQARYPNSGYLTVDAVNGDGTAFYDAALPASPDFTGAQLVIKTNIYSLTKYNVTDFGSDSVKYASSSGISSGDEYFLQRSMVCLDANNEWFYNTADSKLYVYSNTGTPAGFRAATVDTLFYCNGYQYININNIVFADANREALSFNNGSDHIEIKYCSILNAGRIGIRGNDLDDSKIMFNTFNTNLSRSIDLGEGASSGDSICYNVIDSTGMLSGMGVSGTGQYIAIYHRSTTGSNTFYGNFITNTGYAGLHWGGENILIRKNYIEKALATLEDGGAIYCANFETTETNRIIDSNIIINSGYDGIYPDQNCSNIDIKNNTIKNAGHYGIYVHGGSYVKVYDNNLDDASFGALLEDATPMRYNDVRRNVLVGRQSNDWVFYVHNDNVGSFGAIDSNKYIVPQGPGTNIMRRKVGSASSAFISYTQWRTEFSLFDVNSYSNLLSTSLYSYNTTTKQNDSLKLHYNPTFTDSTVTLVGTWKDVKTNATYTGSVVLAPFASKFLAKTIDIDIPVIPEWWKYYTGGRQIKVQ